MLLQDLIKKLKKVEHEISNESEIEDISDNVEQEIKINNNNNKTNKEKHLGKKRNKSESEESSSIEESSEVSESNSNEKTTKKKTKKLKRSTLQEINGFKVLPIKINALSSNQRYLYFKQHNSGKEEDESETDKTLFVTNLTYDCTDDDVKQIFGQFGTVRKVYFSCFTHPDSAEETVFNKIELDKKNFSRAGFARVVFSDSKSLKKALNASIDELQDVWENGGLRGMDKWLEEYRSSQIDPIQLRKEVDTHMDEYDKRESEMKKRIESMRNVPDEEGWITIPKKKSKLSASQDIKVTPSAISTSVGIIDNKDKIKILNNFYRFQKRENKREALTELRRKFEEDKKRIAKLKENRKFRPY